MRDDEDMDMKLEIHFWYEVKKLMLVGVRGGV